MRTQVPQTVERLGALRTADVRLLKIRFPEGFYRMYTVVKTMIHMMSTKCQ